MKEIFKIGDRVVCEGTEAGVDISGQIGTIYGYFGLHQNSMYYIVKFDNRFYNFLHGDDYMCWDVSERRLKFLDPAIEKKRLKEIEIEKFKHINEDPFSEEIWEHLKRFKDYGREI